MSTSKSHGTDTSAGVRTLTPATIDLSVVTVITPPLQPAKEPATHHGFVRSLLEATRPRQWVKNLLVASAPFAAGNWWHPALLRGVGLALLSFVAASAGTYLVNDARDVAEDRNHPLKCRRPIARGDVPPRLALAFGGVLLVISISVPFALGYHALTACTGTYVVITSAYSTWLKHEPVLDLVVVAAGFVLRAMAGGMASGVPLSGWFLVIASFGSLFMVAGKRYSELVLVDGSADTRRALAGYTATYLRFVWSLSAAVVLCAYCLWAFEVGASWHGASGIPWAAISIAPFVVAVLRYALDIDCGSAGAPEDIALLNRPLQLLGLLWLVVFALGVLGV